MFVSHVQPCIYYSFLLFMLQCSLTMHACMHTVQKRRGTFRSINVRAQRNSMPEQEAVKLTRRREGGGACVRAGCVRVSSIAM